MKTTPKFPRPVRPTERGAASPGAIPSRAGRLVLGGLGFLLPGALVAQTPSIEFTSVPPIGSTQNLTGRVTNAVPAAHRVAVYLYVGGWWNKPTSANPQTVIATNGTWTCDITTGGADVAATRVAAFLIPATWSPPLVSGATLLPGELDTNALAQVVTERLSPNTFHFSGYDWDVKNSCGFLFGPGPNVFSDNPQNVWIDTQGRLHLRIAYRDGKWQCAEVISRRSFGYGTYRFFLESAVDAINPNVVLGLFTWSDDPAYTHREIDVEMSRWSNAADTTNAQYVVQPFGTTGHLTRWRLPAGLGTSTHSFRWEPSRVWFQSHQGAYLPPPAANQEITQWTYTLSGVPAPGDERVHLNLWLYNTAAPTDGQPVEVIVSRFAFVPFEPAAPAVTGWSRDASSRFHLQLAGVPQMYYRFEASTNLIDWTMLSTSLAPEAAFEFVDTSTPAPPRRFYRVAVPEQ